MQIDLASVITLFMRSCDVQLLDNEFGRSPNEPFAAVRVASGTLRDFCIQKICISTSYRLKEWTHTGDLPKKMLVP
jgi:hypothetical protein